MTGKVDIAALIPVLEQAGVEEVRYNHGQHRRTYCQVLMQDNHPPIDGFAYCSPSDQFCRRTGRIISLRRAIRALDLKHRRNGRI